MDGDDDLDRLLQPSGLIINKSPITVDSDDDLDQLLRPSGLKVNKSLTTVKDVTNFTFASKSGSNPTTTAAIASPKPPTVVTPKTPKSRPVEVPTTLLEDWISGKNCIGYGMFVGTKEAKKEYFLDTHDLAYLPCDRIGGGIGCGAPMKNYSHDHLVEAGLRKHGRAGVTQKLESKFKREARKRQREQQAARVLEEQSSNKKPKPSQEAKETKKLRASLLKMAKKNMGFQYSGSPKDWRIEVPGTTAATFAALMNRPTDVELRTFVKSGAYYTVSKHDAMELFGLENEESLEKFFSREGVAQKICSGVVVRYKPSAMELSVNGWAEIYS